MNQLTSIPTINSKSIQNLSPAQKKFNRLIKGIQKNSHLITVWEQTYDKLRDEFIQNNLSLMEEVKNLRIKGLILLDEHYQNTALTTRQKEKLYYFIQEIIELCIDSDNKDQLQEIYNRYHETSFDDNEKEYYTSLKSQFEGMFGIELENEFDFTSETSFFDFISNLKEKFEQKEEIKAQKKAKKSKISLQQQKKIEQEHTEILSIKEVFRQLTKVLHPDREMDENEKKRKSELMQRANSSYKNQDLLSLLELQFEIQQIDKNTIEHFSDEKLEVYSRLLQKQQQKMKAELSMIQEKINREFNIPFFYDKPQQMEYYLKKNQDELNEQKQCIIQDLEKFNHVKSLKRWLNALKINKHSRIAMQSIFDEFY